MRVEKFLNFMITGCLFFYSHTVDASENLSHSQISKSGEKSPKKQGIKLSSRDEQILYSKNLNYLHEPYWSYDQKGLEGYGMRILERIKPLIVNRDAIQCVESKRCSTVVNGKKIELRKVREFGRVLPLLYLRDRLKGNKALAVPQMFLFPLNPSGPVTFTFHFPSRAESLYDLGNNPLQVTSDDFDIYQEYITGEGKVGDKSFAPFGHLDFNAKQVITSQADRKKYLIDTKEQKSYILPIFWTNYKDIVQNPVFPEMYTGHKKEVALWEQNLHTFMIETKIANLGEDLRSLKVTIPCGVKCSSQNVPQPPATYKTYDFAKSNPRYLLRQAIGKGDTGGVKVILAQNPDISLMNEMVPEPGTMNKYAPVEAAIQLIGDAGFRLNMVKLLVSKGATLTGALSAAIDKNDVDLVNYLLDNGEIPSSKDVSKVVTENKLYILRSLAFKTKNKSEFENELNIYLFLPNLNLEILKVLISASQQETIFKATSSLMDSNKQSQEKKITIGTLLIDAFKDAVPDSTTESIVKSGLKGLIEKLFDKNISKIEVIRLACQYRKAALVDLLLSKKKLTDDEIDTGVVVALHQIYMEVVEKLLALKPTQTPKADQYISENIYNTKAEAQYTATPWWDLMFHDAIVGRHDLVFDLLYKHLKEIKWYDVSLALKYNYFHPITRLGQRTYQTNNMHVLQRLLDRDFLKKLGYLEDGKTVYDTSSRLGGLLHQILGDAFEHDDQEVLDYIQKTFSDVLGRMSYWTIRSAVQAGRNEAVMRFMKTDEEFSDGLALAGEFGNVSLANTLMVKLSNKPKEPEALDYALAQVIYHLKDGVGQKTIQEALWKRILELKNKKLEATITAAIESDNSSLEYLKMILDRTKYNVNFEYNFVTPLIHAIVANDIGMVKFLLEYGADANLPGKSYTLGYPLTFAILQFVKYMPSSQRGARAYEKKYTKDGKFDEFNMANKDDHNLEFVDLLLKHGANPRQNINLPNPEKQNTYLTLAKYNHLPRITERFKGILKPDERQGSQ